MTVKPSVSIDSKNEIKFPKTASSYFIGTAGQKAFGRGDTIDRAHLSEAAFYQDFEKIFAGIAEAAEYGQIDIETTPNGRNAFYDLWQRAKAGKSPYTCIFIPWFIDKEYSVDNMTQKEREGLSKAVQELFNIPEDQFILTEEEKKLVERVEVEYKFKLTVGQLKWRRYKIWDKGALFFQEYPEDDVSCFLQSGRSVFSILKCDPSLKVPLDNFESWKDNEARTEFKRHMLYGAVDGAVGLEDGDRHVFSVISSPANSSTAVVVYEYASTEPINVFWSKIFPILNEFNINLAIEDNGVGIAHTRHAETLGVSFTPWTTGTNRPAMISELEEAYRKGELIETYDEAENEARDMIYNSAGKAEAMKGKHDDRILSRSMAWQMRGMPSAGISLF